LTEAQSEFDPANAVAVGRIVAPHGIRGELSVQPLTDFPDRFRVGARLWLDGVQRRVQSSRWQARLVALKLDGIDDRNAAEAVRGHELQVPALHELTESDVFYQHDVIGLRVVDVEGQELGRVEDILSTGSNDVYVVRGERGELLLPAIEDVIKEIDVAGGSVTVELLPGLEFHKSQR
jgi:16S rRNA processing protein RimM